MILGLGGNDTIRGAEGNDRLCGGSGNDALNGDSGDDGVCLAAEQKCRVSVIGSSALLAVVEVLRDLNRRGARRVPDDAPVGFVPRSWRRT